jgi:hypothetical protein
MNQVITQCESLGKGNNMKIQLGFRDNTLFKELKDLETKSLNGHIYVSMQSAGLAFGTQGAINGGEITFDIKTDTVIDFEKELRNQIK